MLTLLTAVVAAAQVASAAPAATPVDPARLAAAAQLVDQLGIRGQIERSAAQNVAAMKSGAGMRAMLAQQPGFIQAYQANRPKFDKALQAAGAIQAEIAQKVIAANLGTVVNAAAKSYARNFSLAELQGLSAFYRTPLGQALYTRQPRINAEIGAATSQIIGAKLDAAMKANASRIEAALAPLNSAPPAAKK
ncbi:MAG: DUF2059 domain-containing protein [Sandarakinorhabdus sp.]|nr:DUF2059 domain-containing protein [Sandarakinorhabdus sp.]